MSDDCLQRSATPVDVAADGAFTGSLATDSVTTGGDSQEGNNYQFVNTEPPAEQNEAWNLDSYFQSQGEDKNIFSELSEEHLSQLEDVLSSDAVNSLLQQAADFQTLESNLMMDNQAPSTSFAFDEATAHQIIQDGVREHELAVIAAAFNDHAYAMPVNREPKAGVSSEQFESSDLIATQPVAMTTSGDAQKKDSDVDESPQPVRRSTRISDAEQREMAEKILQENRQKAREALMTKEDGVEDEEEKEKDEPKKGKRGRKPKAEVDASNPLNTKWNKNNRRTRSNKGPGETESGDEGVTEEEEPSKPAVARAKKTVTGTETPPPMKRVSRGKWKNPLFRDRPDTPDRASPAKTPPTKKSETTDTDGEAAAAVKRGRGKKKEEEEVVEQENVDKDAELEADVEEKEGEVILKTKAAGKKGGKKGQGKAHVKGQKGKVKVEETKEGSMSSEEDIPLQQLKDTKQKTPKTKAKPKPKAKATLVKPESTSQEDDDDNDNLPLKQLGKSPTKLKKLKAAISAKRAVKNVPQKAALVNNKSKLLKMRPQSQILKKKILQKQKQAVRKQKLKEEEEARLEEEKQKLEMANAAEKLAAKRKARKSETEVFLDPTMTDLFKPDGMIVHDKDTPLSPDGKSSKIQQVKVEKNEAKVTGDTKKVLNVKEEKKEKSEARKSLDGKSEKPDFKKIEDEKSSENKVDKSEVNKVQEVMNDKTGSSKVADVKNEKQPKFQKDSEVKVENTDVKKVAEVKGEKSEVKKVAEVKGEKSEVKKVAEVKGEKSEVKKVAEVKGEKSEVKKVTEVKVEKDNVTSKQEKKVEESPHKKGSDEKCGVEMKTEKFYSNKKERGSVGENSSVKQDKERRHSKSSIPEKTSIADGRKTDTHEDSDSEGGLSYVDDENDSDWDPGEDPNTLYCLCNKPHNNRFMIQCDGCEKWYHGSCVGVSKAMGQEFEAENMDFICPVCTEAGIDSVNKAPKKFHSPVKLKRKDSSSNHETSVTSTTSVDTPKKLSTSSDKRKSIEKPTYQKCVGKYCNKDARSGSVYCSNECIIQHAKLSLKLLHQDREKVTPKKREEPDTSSVKKDGESKVVVLERKTGCILNGPTAPTESNLQDWLEKHPTFEVLQPNISSSSSSSKSTSKSSSSSSSHRHHHHRHSSSSTSRHGSSSSSKDRDRKDRDRKDRDRKDRDRKDRDKHHKDRHKSDSSTSEKKTDAKKDEGPDPIRLNVRKGLRDALANRADHADDVMLSSSEIKHLSLKIEEELYKYFKDVGHKYKSKYRSLVFNIKDPKNNGLFRKILSGKIRASKLVQMSSTELASKELAEWRKMETKHTLDMIEETEKKAMKEAVHIRKKTHKGEVELDEDLSTLRDEVEKPTPVKTKIEAKTDLLSELIVDTTDKHRTHLFDLNCKVCTGKMAPPADDSSAKKVTVAHAVDKTEEAEEEEEKTTLKAEDIAKAEEVVKEALENVKKIKIEMPESPKVTVRSPDSALQSGLESRAKFTPSGPVLWKGFIHMQEFNKFFTSAYRVSGPTDGLGFADTIQICGRIVPEQIWDYLSKIKQASSRDICVIRFIPAGDEEKISYVNLYSYLNSRGRCGVVGNSPKHIKDFYIIPLASHSRIPQLLLPFDGPGLEDNRPHMLIGVIVRQKKKISKPEKPITPTLKSKPSSTVEGVSSSKKARLSLDEEDSIFAYKPKGDKSARSSNTAVYIPTMVSGGSGSSSEAGTPSGYKDSHDPIVKAYSMDDVAPLETEISPDADNEEAYSPSKIAEEEEPYDPEMEEAEVKKPAPSSAMLRAMQSTLASLGEIEATANPAPHPIEPTQQPKAALNLPVINSNGNPKGTASSSGTVPETISSVQTTTPAPSSQNQGPGASVTDSSANKAAFSVEKLVQQIANSTNPNEITALMVTALAASKQSTNQQQALADLTQKIEEQKRLLALKKAEIEKVRNSPVLSTEASTPDDPIIVNVTPAKIKKSVSSKSQQREKEAVKEKSSESMKEELKTPSIPEVQKEVLSISVSSSSAVDPQLKTESISVSSMKPHEMPLALQALMKDVMGHGTEQGIKSKKIQKEKEESKESKGEAPHEKDKDSLAIFKNLENRDKNVIPGLGDLPIASVLEQAEMIKAFEIVKGVAIGSGAVSTDVKTSLEDEASLDKDYRTELSEGKTKDDGLSTDEKTVHILDKDERLARGMLPRFIPTQNKKDWSSPTSAEQTESLDVDHRKFSATATTASSTVSHGGPPMMPPVVPPIPPPVRPMIPQSMNQPVPLVGPPLLHQGGLPESKEGNFRPIGGPPLIDPGKRDIDQRNPEGNMRPIGGNPFGLAGQDVDMRRGPGGPPPPIPPPVNPMQRPPFPGSFPSNPRMLSMPNYRSAFPGQDAGSLRMRGAMPGAYIGDEAAGTKRGSSFLEGEAGGKKPRIPGQGFVSQDMHLGATSEEGLLPIPPGMPPLPEEPLPPPPQLPPPLTESKTSEKGDLTTPGTPVSKSDAVNKHPKDQDHRGDNRMSNHRSDERRDSRDRDRDRERYHSRHRHRDSRDRDRHRDRDYRSRDGRR